MGCAASKAVEPAAAQASAASAASDASPALHALSKGPGLAARALGSTSSSGSAWGAAPNLGDLAGSSTSMQHERNSLRTRKITTQVVEQLPDGRKITTTTTTVETLDGEEPSASAPLVPRPGARSLSGNLSARMHGAVLAPPSRLSQSGGGPTSPTKSRPAGEPSPLSASARLVGSFKAPVPPGTPDNLAPLRHPLVDRVSSRSTSGAAEAALAAVSAASASSGGRPDLLRAPPPHKGPLAPLAPTSPKGHAPALLGQDLDSLILPHKMPLAQQSRLPALPGSPHAPDGGSPPESDLAVQAPHSHKLAPVNPLLHGALQQADTRRTHSANGAGSPTAGAGLGNPFLVGRPQTMSGASTTAPPSGGKAGAAAAAEAEAQGGAAPAPSGSKGAVRETTAWGMAPRSDSLSRLVASLQAMAQAPDGDSGSPPASPSSRISSSTSKPVPLPAGAARQAPPTTTSGPAAGSPPGAPTAPPSGSPAGAAAAASAASALPTPDGTARTDPQGSVPDSTFRASAATSAPPAMAAAAGEGSPTAGAVAAQPQNVFSSWAAAPQQQQQQAALPATPPSPPANPPNASPLASPTKATPAPQQAPPQPSPPKQQQPPPTSPPRQQQPPPSPPPATSGGRPVRRASNGDATARTGRTARRSSSSSDGQHSDRSSPGLPLVRASRPSSGSRSSASESVVLAASGGGSMTMGGVSSGLLGIASASATDLVTRALRRGLGSFNQRSSMDGARAAQDLDRASPVRKRPVSTCAVSLAFLLEFSARVPADMSTLDVVYKIIVPETSRSRCRYVDFVSDDHLSTPDYFVSHRWAAPFKNLVSSLFLHFDCARCLANGTLDPATVYLWLDIFAVNQHPGEAQAGDLAGLKDSLGASRSGTLLCLDEAGLVLTRIWCLYEVHHTIRLKGTPGLRVLAADVQFTELRDIFNSLDAKHAQATVEEDRKRILDDIQATTGIEALNHGIKEALVESCIHEARASEGRLWGGDPAAFVSAHYKAGQMLRVAGRYQEAEEALQKTIEVYEEGEDVAQDKLYAICLISLGTLMQETGKLVEAERLCRLGLKLSERLMVGTVAHYQEGGEEMPGVDMTVADVMAAYNALAGVLQAQGKFNEALPYFEKAVSTCRKVRGESHPDTATAMQSLALLLQAMGRSNEALKLLRRALALREKHLGMDHPLTAVSYDALGMALHQKGDFTGAEPQFLKALEVRRRVLGDLHPAVGSSLHNLGAVLADQGRHGEAEEALLAALELREQVLGPVHPASAATLNNLAALYKETGRVDEAVPLLERALEARTRVLGPEHPATSSSLNNLATLLLERGHLEDAQPLYIEHIRVLEKVLGPAHADVAVAIQNYAMCLRAAGQLERAASLFTRALGILEAAAGHEHPDVAHCAANIGALHEQQGQYAAATAQYERALSIRRRLHGQKHASLVPLLHSMGVVAARQGLLDVAEARLRAAIAMRRELSTTSTAPSRPLSAITGSRPLSSGVNGGGAAGPSSRRSSVYVSPSHFDAGGGGGLLTSSASSALQRMQSEYSTAATASAARNMSQGMTEADCQLASSLFELGTVLEDGGQADEALESFNECLELREGVLAEDHLDVAAAREAVGCALLELKRAKEAEPMLRSALAVNAAKATGGVTALTAYNLGRCLEKLPGRWAEARDAYTQAVALATQALGANHEDTAQYRTNLGDFLSAGEPKQGGKKRGKSAAAKSTAGGGAKAASGGGGGARSAPASGFVSDEDDDLVF